MIRDPSDGSMRELTPEEDRLVNKALIASGTLVQERLEPASGLREPSQKPAVQARLEKSREWLKTYFHRKEIPNG